MQSQKSSHIELVRVSENASRQSARHQQSTISKEQAKRLLKQAKRKAASYSIHHLCILFRYIGYLVVILSESSEFSKPQGDSPYPSPQLYFINLFNVAGCPQLLVWFLIIQYVFIPRFKHLHQQQLTSQQNQSSVKDANKLKKQIITLPRQKQINLAVDMLSSTIIGIEYKAIFYDQIVDILLLLKTGLIFVATILITIHSISYSNFLTNIGFALSLSSLIIQKLMKLQQFYWQIQDKFQKQVLQLMGLSSKNQNEINDKLCQNCNRTIQQNDLIY